MEKPFNWKNSLLHALSYVLVAAVASAVTFFLCGSLPSKLDQLEGLIDEKFIGQADKTAMEDAAAEGMIAALGDRWSYYIPASQYEAHKEQKNNAYVGVGITITAVENGFEIVQVEPGGAAWEQGILPGDILLEAQGQPVSELGLDGVGNVIRGKEGTTVSVSVLRDGEKLTFELERRTIQVQVAEGQLLEGNVGLVTIHNFNKKCADETIGAVDALIEQGAQALIFDVRNNPGGYLDELTKLLDYLLPEGVIFRSMDYSGKEETEESDESCLQLPMAVLVNGSSYSAAEFFAAALDEYDWAVTVGDPTSGKGYYQNTYQLSDGSAVGLSVGKYFTPNGVSLADEGGLVPEVLVEVDEKTAALIYADAVEPAEDPQITAAVEALLQKR